MKAEQKVVAVGAASGIVSMVLGVWIFSQVLPGPMIPDVPQYRLVYALIANVFAVIPFFIMIATVGNQRFLSEAIDPTRHAESKRMEVNGRVADNTLQQTFVFAVSSLALSVVVPFQHVQVIWAAAMVFFVARMAFWFGYQKNPLYRAPGMAATSYLNLAMIIAVLLYTFG